MLHRLYIDNFRCFVNFECKPAGQAAILLLGNNGSGKSTVMHVLALFQALGRGKNRVGDLVKPTDFAQANHQLPMRFELEVVLDGQQFAYSFALELPDRFKELSVREEQLTRDGVVLFRRESSKVTVSRQPGGDADGVFAMDGHLLVLPVIFGDLALTGWLADMVLLAPVPQDMAGEALGRELAINGRASNVADWLADLLEGYPAAYTGIIEHLKQVMPDMKSFRFEKLGRDSRALMIQFSNQQADFELPLTALSDGEKCFVLGAVLIGLVGQRRSRFVFWDEPDNYLAAHEVKQFVVALKRAFLRGQGQLMVSSHNSEAIMSFSDDSTWVMGRRSHLEPAMIRCLDELQSGADGARPSLMQRLHDGDLVPWQ